MDSVYKTLFFYLMIIFIISSNIAWLNPRPHWVCDGLKLSKSFPFLWQYNKDSVIELSSAAYFPDIFRAHPTRINRPIYPFIANSFSHIFYPFLLLLTSLDQNTIVILSTILGYLLLKLCVFSIIGYLFYKLLESFFSKRESLFTVGLLLFHRFSIQYITTYHTTELQFASPIIIAYMFNDISKNYTLKKNIAFSLIVGILMLAKQNYAIYLGIILFSLYYRRFKEITISVITHSIPLATWRIYLFSIDIPFYNTEFKKYNYGFWIFEKIFDHDIFFIFRELFVSFYQLLTNSMQFYSIFLLFACTGFKYLKNENILKSFFFFTILSTWIQLFATRRYLAYMTSDFSFIIFGLGSLGLINFLPQNIKDKSWIFPAILFIWLVYNILLIVNMPWIPPINHGKL